MKIHLLDPAEIKADVDALHRAPYEELLQHAVNSDSARHVLVHNIDNADLIIASIQGDGFGRFFENLREHAVFARYSSRIFLYCPDDNAYPFVPGVYPATSAKWVSLGWTTGGHYVTGSLHKHKFNAAEVASATRVGRKYLFSFIGASRTHRVREDVLGLRHPDACLHDVNPRSDEDHWWNRTDFSARLQHFRSALLDTKFALCPRGISASSIRLFEAMEAGCVPVIIADALVLPMGPSWEDFAIRIPENRLVGLPAILEASEGRFAAMSGLARQAWEEYFSPQRSFDTIVRSAERLQAGLAVRRAGVERLILGLSYLDGAVTRRRIRNMLYRLRRQA